MLEKSGHAVGGAGTAEGRAWSNAARSSIAEPGRPLVSTPEEMRARGWDRPDVVFVSGDAYVDHPSFAMALLGRLLESSGYRVAILAQPDWQSCDAWRSFGPPRLFFAISAGNMDSMINHYTANRKVRNDDAYSPDGRIGMRPDRATLAYCQRAREAYKGIPVVAGGVEASLRRIAHYDYWSDKVRRSILMDCKADLLGFGMGERGILEIARTLDEGGTIDDLRDLRGVAYRLGASETPPTERTLELPSYEDAAADPIAFCDMTRIAHRETNPFNAKRLTQRHGRETVVVNPPALPLTRDEMDRVYDLPFTRRPHPMYGDAKIPAHEVVKTSVQIMRGCFGGCTFCSITAHEGRIIQSRSQDSVMREMRRMKKDPGFSGVVSDIGGPTANMYEMRCSDPEVEKKCRRLSCVHPKICKLLGTDHGPLRSLMKKAREEPGIRKVFVASGIRMDLARLDEEYMDDLVQHHVGGYLKVAPEHTDPHVLDLMKKPDETDFVEFGRAFEKASKKAGKKQYLIPYFIASHPGSDLNAMIDLALFLKRNHYKPDQVQDFIPSPFDIAACMYHTGLDPHSKKPVAVAKHLRDRKLQRALLQFFKPENWFEVRKALLEAGRRDLIGDGCDCLIPSEPPKEAMTKRRDNARTAVRASGSAKGANRSGSKKASKSGSKPGTSARRGSDRRDDDRARTERRRAGGAAGYRPHRKSRRS